MSGATSGLRILVVSASPRLARAWTQAARARGHTPVAYLTTSGPSLRRLEGYAQLVQEFAGSTDVIVSSRPSLWARIFEPYDLDLITCCAFPWRLPVSLLELPRHGAINVHNSLLPKYRGAGPNVFGWAFRNDEHETGITIHRMAPELDTGPILVQERVPIHDDDDVHDLIERLGPARDRAMDLAIAAVEAGAPGVPQDGSGFYCAPFEEEWRRVDWSRQARQVHNQIRSWTGLESQGYAVALLDGAEVTIRRTRLVADRLDAGGTVPGTVLNRGTDGVLVQCCDRPLLVVDWRPR